MEKKNDLADLQKQLGYQKQIYDDSIILIDELIASRQISEKYREDLMKTIAVMTLGYDPKDSSFFTHMDFDLSNDLSDHTIIFFRNLYKIGVREEDNYDDSPEKDFVGITISKEE